MIKLMKYCSGILLLLNLVTIAKDYNGAELYSKGSVKYGRFDVRMRAVSGSGIISSFFLYYDSSYMGSPEPWQEIDVEVMGKNSEAFQSNLITGNAASKKTSEKMHPYANISQSYHTYSMEWTPDYIAWFFDGTEVRRATGDQVKACQPKPMSCRFNLWISSETSWAGAFNNSILPVYQYLNWIKYSKYTPGAGPGGSDFTPDWQDDFDSFNSSRWGKGDWTFDGNLVDFSTSNLVIKDGYCIICLTKNNATGFSGVVPKDDPTSIQREKTDTPFKIHNPANSQKTSLFSVTPDGRLVVRNAAHFNGVRSGLVITSDNNTIVRDMKFSK